MKCYPSWVHPGREPFLRWVSAYSPIMEVMQDTGRNIWYDYDKTPPPTGEKTLAAIASQQAQLHHDLIPYTQSIVYQATRTGVPALRAMMLEFPTDAKVADLADQYMLGPSLLVAPVITASATPNAASRNVYLPAGNWLDYNDRKTTYSGTTGQTITVRNVTLDAVPVFVRAGAIVPRGDILKSNNNWDSNWAAHLDIEVFAALNLTSSFDYYTGAGTVPITAALAGDGSYDVSFADLGLGGELDVYLASFSSLLLNANPLGSGAYTWDPASHLLTVPFATGGNTLEILNPADLWSTAPAAPGLVTQVVPEPGTLALLGLGGLLLLRRRR